MIAILLLACGSIAAPPTTPETEEVFYVDASLDFKGALLNWQFVDIVGDEGLEFVAVIGEKDRERELRVYELRNGTLNPEPIYKLSLLKDILAWGVADVRAEAGHELLLLTSGGIWSYSLEHAGYRDNVEALVQVDLIFDLANPRDCDYWAYVLPAGERDRVVVPERDGATIWGLPPGAVEGAAFERLATLTTPAPIMKQASDYGEEEQQGLASVGNGEITISFDDWSIFLEDNPRADAALFSASFRIDAPALADIDGDGLLDIIYLLEDSLLIRMGMGEGAALGPERIEPLPKRLRELEGEELVLRLVDLDGDGDLDLLVHLEREEDGFKNPLQRLLVYTNDGETLLREKADQQLRFEAAGLQVDVVDVDGDGRRDLVIRKIELPSLLSTATGLEFKLSYLVFLGERKGFARKPCLKQEQTFDENSVVEIAGNREIALDCDGDGLADLVEIDLQGRIAIRRMQHSSSFFGGDDWSLEDAPWKRFETETGNDSLVVGDFNGDGLCDIVSEGESRLTLLLSSKRGQQ